MRKTKIKDAVGFLAQAADLSGRNLSMAGIPHYQPKTLRPLLGYDQWMGWCVIVEWFWLVELGRSGIIPAKTRRMLTPRLLRKLLFTITTTAVTKIEREVTKHDILALLHEMRPLLPKALRRWLHFGATSYDIISTAYALQLLRAYEEVFVPLRNRVDCLWRSKILKTQATVRIGRTHLQYALPITAGRWLAVLHQRFRRSCDMLDMFAGDLVGKFAGAVGNKASQVLFFGQSAAHLEHELMRTLGFRTEPGLSTQIVQQEPVARFYGELALLSGILGNLGEDARLLQASGIEEVCSASSSSSAMPHKTSNPIAAENLSGMHTSVLGEYLKVLLTQGSNLERDLTGSNVMRGYSAMLVFVVQQLLTAERLLGSLEINEVACRANMTSASNIIVAEALHLFLQREGFPDTHAFVHKTVVPLAFKTGKNLADLMDEVEDKRLRRIWKRAPRKLREVLRTPALYLGTSVGDAQLEAVQ